VEHGQGSVPLLMLRQLMKTRRALLLLDGLDEGGIARERIEQHIVEVLAPQGHLMFVTSRPASVSDERFVDFHRLCLLPLSEAQQKLAVTQRLGQELAQGLMPYVLQRVLIDSELQLRITSNPLMLSMITSIFEIRQGLEMPSTAVELYEEATKGMITHSALPPAQQRAVVEALVALFCHAQVEQRRVITEQHLARAAARNSGLKDGLRVLRERAVLDKMPLVSVLQVEPLEIQAIHLSFQEFFVARALCEDPRQLTIPAPPWTLGVFWGNVIKLGAEMGGTSFGEGLLQATGIAGLKYLYGFNLGKHRPTALAALHEVLNTPWRLEKLVLNQQRLDDSTMHVIFHSFGPKALPNLKWLDLSCNRIGDDGLAVLSESFGRGAVASLTDLMLWQNQIGNAGLQALMAVCDAGALLMLEELWLHNNAFDYAGVRALASTCAAHHLPALKNMVLNAEQHSAELSAACQARSIELDELEFD